MTQFAFTCFCRGSAGRAGFPFRWAAVPFLLLLQGISSKRIGKANEAVCAWAFGSTQRVALAPIYAPSAALRSSPEPWRPAASRFLPRCTINRVLDRGLVCDARYIRSSVGSPISAANQPPIDATVRSRTAAMTTALNVKESMWGNCYHRFYP